MAPICLITPPSCFLMDERVFASLGILRVAACLERDGYAVEHLDLSGIENYEEAARDHAARSDAEIFGLTATTPQMPSAAMIVAAVRGVRPATRIVLGGPHITLVNAARKREFKKGIIGRAHRAFDVLADMFDVLVAGDGDDAVFHAIMPDAPKLVDADDAASALFLTNERYDEIPWPSRHLVDMDSYHYTIEGRQSCSLIAQLGCPYGCGFCGGRESSMLRRIRTRSTENIIAELELLYRTYGYTGFMFYDDELNVSKSMIELMDAITDLQARLGVDFRLRGFVKSNLFTDDQAESMYRAGFRWILVGFESGSPRILDNIQKKATREENSRCMDIARRHGLKVKALMSVGHPGESAETVEQTRQWLLQERPDDFDVTCITVYPGTPYYDHAVETCPRTWTYTAKNGDTLHSWEVDFTHEQAYYKGRPGEYTSLVFTDHLTPEQLVSLRDDLEADVRTQLGIPYPTSASAVRFEHSMGMSGSLPPNILRATNRVGESLERV